VGLWYAYMGKRGWMGKTRKKGRLILYVVPELESKGRRPLGWNLNCPARRGGFGGRSPKRKKKKVRKELIETTREESLDKVLKILWAAGKSFGGNRAPR